MKNQFHGSSLVVTIFEKLWKNYSHCSECMIMIDVLESDGNYSCNMMEKSIPIIAEKLPFILN